MMHARLGNQLCARDLDPLSRDCLEATYISNLHSNMRRVDSWVAQQARGQRGLGMMPVAVDPV